MPWPLLGDKEKPQGGFLGKGFWQGSVWMYTWKGKWEYTKRLSNPASWAEHGWS